MSIMDILWPWAALREAKRKLAAETHINRNLSDKLHRLSEQRENDRKEFDLRGRILRAEIDRLTELLRQGHFRNPKTGRLGRKGERF